jgi:hypothetical protein
MMKSRPDTSAPTPRPAALPPKGPLPNFLVQAPPLAWHWPPFPTVPVLISGAMVILAGAILNIGDDALFRRDGARA